MTSTLITLGLGAVALALPAALLTLSLPLAAHAQPTHTDAGNPGRDESFESAMTDYERGHWNKAWLAFAKLADGGDRRAARLALQMAHHGSRLFGGSFVVTPERKARWLTVLTGPESADPPWEPGPHGC